MGELGIKKDAYYAYLKHLGLKANKDSEGKAYLDPEQANLIRLLRAHVEKSGKMEGFERAKSTGVAGGALAQNGDSSALNEAHRTELEQLVSAVAGDDVDAADIQRIIYGAGQLKAEELILHQAIQQELAAQMEFDDLPEELQTKVRAFREGSGPKFDPTQAASAVLGKWREIRERQRAAAL